MNENIHDSGRVKAESSSWARFWARVTGDADPSVAHRLYDRLVRHARFPVYYRKLGAPDTPEGRFEILALHVGLLVRELCRQGDEGQKAGQALFDLMIADLDMNLRELGVGDLSVGKQVKRLARQFYARLAVLNDAFDGGKIEALAPMLETNVLPEPKHVDALADIIVALREALDGQDPRDLMAGRINLPDEPALIAIIDRRQAGATDE